MVVVGGAGAAALVVTETVGWWGWLGGLVGEGRWSGREQRSEERRRQPPDRHDRPRQGEFVPWSMRTRQQPKSMIAAKFSVSLCRCARLPRSLRCVCAGANEIGGKYATLRATRSRRLFR